MNGEPPKPAPRSQPRLPFPREPDYDRDSFVVSDSNRDAVQALDAWPRWPGGRLTLVGPTGAGKTHLAHAWAKRVGATLVDDQTDLATLPSGPVVFEDADRRSADSLLFHLLNRADAGVSLLLTARTPPRSWTSALPDLPSRFNALPFATLSLPDDRVLEALLRTFFRERDIRPDPELLSYLLRRIDRSAPGAWVMVDRLDAAADAAGRGVTRALAREILERDDKGDDSGK